MLFACVLLALPAQVGAAEARENGSAVSLEQAFTDGNLAVSFRYRYEFVDQDAANYAGTPFTKQANASTLRTRLVFTTAEYKNLYLTLNVDDVRPIVSSNFNDTRNGKSQYPVVADPKGTDLNLASLTYTGLDNGTVVLGRQRIVRENARFIGNVVWRQNEQTYDSASVDYAVTDKLQVFYAYVDRVKRIFGPEDGAPAASLSSDAHLLDASYTFSPALRVTGYGYWLDFADSGNLSSETLGLRLTGRVGATTAFAYTAEFARQSDYKDNPNDFSENYLHLIGGIERDKFSVKLGYESLGGSAGQPTEFGQAFQTPLATLHAFNGRADQFLLTPGTGLRDSYIAGSGPALGGKITLTYHDFEPDAGGGDFGTELDLFASWPLYDSYSILAGVAAFNSQAAFLSDVSKVWLMFSADF